MHQAAAQTRQWDDFMARLGIELHTALTLEISRLRPLEELAKPRRTDRSPDIAEAVRVDERIVDALVSHPDSSLAELRVDRYGPFRESALRDCAFLRERNAALEADLRVCEHNRKRDFQDWWTVRCGWDPPR
ncbi:hypothetical protein [Segniliparus rugosus]|uniref:Uncharacterized protein n=1 Tax=Segniliparus rugosus (strain ATCC BAA-974 / DSM 45345 / CCUG 50838 / CIP 108380 / JCM 13579 / CDC 945) TaxID=679197 RepID=E5XLV2_SEGRC|nr:hypothetical protein [Segniliparus rugosus]EFV14679.1 hypothetical protein HMPREF9336_00471 [Segniliparus rugosus ATCC BAA-974]